MMTACPAGRSSAMRCPPCCPGSIPLLVGFPRSRSPRDICQRAPSWAGWGGCLGLVRLPPRQSPLSAGRRFPRARQWRWGEVRRRSQSAPARRVEERGGGLLFSVFMQTRYPGAQCIGEVSPTGRSSSMRCPPCRPLDVPVFIGFPAMPPPRRGCWRARSWLRESPLSLLARPWTRHRVSPQRWSVVCPRAEQEAVTLPAFSGLGVRWLPDGLGSGAGRCRWASGGG